MKYKKIGVLLVAVIAALVVNFGVAFAADYRNQEKIPGAESTTDLVSYLGQIYKFGIAIGALLALLMIAMGAFSIIISSAGNASKVADGKGMIQNAIYGLVIVLTAFLVLYVVNPDLINGKLKGMPSFEESVRQGAVYTSGGGSCSPMTSGPCSVDNLKNTCMGSNAEKASAICNKESGGNVAISSGTDKCQPGGESVSWGAFQINISANTIDGLNCPKAFDRPYTGSNHSCKVVDQELYDKCVAAAKNFEKNLKKACELSKNGEKWSAWGANSICKF